MTRYKEIQNPSNQKTTTYSGYKNIPINIPQKQTKLNNHITAQNRDYMVEMVVFY
jgi:hypothetical protein